MSAASPFERSRGKLPWNTPWLVKRMVPQAVRERLHRLRMRFLSFDLPRHIEFVQPAEEAEASASVSIIVPIHDALAVTRRCLNSLERYAPKSEVILVDDGSLHAETLGAIRDFGARNGWNVLRHEEALGHSRACEAGAGLARRPYLCLLNSDTVVTPWCWRGPVGALEADPKIAVAGPSTSLAGTAQQVPLANYCRHYWNDCQIAAFASDLVANCADPVWVDLPWVAGFALFVRRSVWDELGGFDANLPDYSNEVDLCERVSKLGYRSVWVRNSYIHHLGGQSYKTLGAQAAYAQSRAAQHYVARKHGM